MNFLDALNWRYAAKRMNGNRIPEHKIRRILEAARLAPSSYGLQPYSLLFITDREMLMQIQAQAAQQPQITECSHLVVFATRSDVDEKLVDTFIELTAEQRDMDSGDLRAYADVIKGTVTGFESDQAKQAWAARQAYIALGFLLAGAALEEVDATPMEGFDPSELDRVLGLQAKGLRSVVIAALGYRDTEKDYLAGLPKVRWPRSQLIQAI